MYFHDAITGVLQGNSTKPTSQVSTLSLMEHGGMHSALLSPPDARVDMVTTPGASEGLRSALRSPSPIRNPFPTASGVVTKSTPSAAAQSGGNGGTSPYKPHYESTWMSERKNRMPSISEVRQFWMWLPTVTCVCFTIFSLVHPDTQADG